MAERYTRLLLLENPKWSIHSPVILEKGALLRDNVANANLLQFQFRNIGHDTIKAIIITVNCFDVISKEMVENLEFNYLDLNAKNNDAFGSNVPIVLQKDETRDFEICINKVIFADGIIKELDSDLKDVESPKGINELGELSGQFKTEVKTLYPSVKCTTLPQKYDHYWYCACGAFNRNHEKDCRVCGSHSDQLIELENLDYLTSQKQQAKEKEDEKKKQTSKKTRKCAVIAGIVLVAIIAVACFAKPYMLSSEEREIFNSAEVAYSNKEYLSAYSLYAQLPDYKIAKERINSIEMPLRGSWKSDAKDAWCSQYYFDSSNLYFAYTWDDVDLASKESFINSRFYYDDMKYKLESLEVNPDGTISFSYDDTQSQEMKFTIKVISNNCIHLFYDVNNSETYDTYYRTS